MNKETTPPVGNLAELPGCFPAFILEGISKLQDRLDMTPEGKFRRQILNRNFSRQPWVNLAISDVGRALAKELIDKTEHDSIIDAIRIKATAELAREYRK